MFPGVLQCFRCSPVFSGVLQCFAVFARVLTHVDKTSDNIPELCGVLQRFALFAGVLTHIDKEALPKSQKFAMFCYVSWCFLVFSAELHPFGAFDRVLTYFY